MPLNRGLEQYRLITAERELLEKTLMGSLKVLSEILSMVNPMAFSRATRTRRYVQHIGRKMQSSNGWWQFEVAALLSQIGCVTLPPDTLDKIYAQVPLTAGEQNMFDSHPTVARNLLTNIPRLESIARMIASQQQPFETYLPPESTSKEESTIALGAQILKVVLDFDQLIIHGLAKHEALASLRAHPDKYNPQLVAAPRKFSHERSGGDGQNGFCEGN